MKDRSSALPAEIARTYSRNVATSMVSSVFVRPAATAEEIRVTDASLYCRVCNAVQRAASYPQKAVNTVAAEIRITEHTSTARSKRDSFFTAPMRLAFLYQHANHFRTEIHHG